MSRMLSECVRLFETLFHMCLQKINLCFSCHLNVISNSPSGHYFATQKPAIKHHNTFVNILFASQHVRSAIESNHPVVWPIEANTVFIWSVAYLIRFYLAVLQRCPRDPTILISETQISFFFQHLYASTTL